VLVRELKDPVLREALAIIFGGGIEGARGEGMHTFNRMMRDYVKRYLDVLKWLGVERSLLFPRSCRVT